MTGRRARLAGAAVHLPPTWRSSTETEHKITHLCDSAAVPAPGFLLKTTGVHGVHVMNDDQDTSDLAVLAGTQALADAVLDPDDIDLLIFAAASQDLSEPATAHIVAAKMGLTCPVFDIKNACTSVLNAIEVAAAFITSGSYRTILITSGECPSRVVRWTIPTKESLARALASFTLSDGGAALILTAGPDGPQDPGVLRTVFHAHSTAWPLATIGGGSRWPREGSSLDDDERYPQVDGPALHAAASCLAESAAAATFSDRGLTSADWSAFAMVGVHQINDFFHRELAAAFAIPPGLIVSTVAQHGNLGAATLPLQLVRARARGQARPGGLVALIGVGSGMSLGYVVLRL